MVKKGGAASGGTGREAAAGGSGGDVAGKAAGGSGGAAAAGKTGGNLLTRVMAESGQPVNLCFQCKKCSAGCPMIGEFDYPPNMVMRMVQLGEQIGRAHV